MEAIEPVSMGTKFLTIIGRNLPKLLALSTSILSRVIILDVITTMIKYVFVIFIYELLLNLLSRLST